SPRTAAEGRRWSADADRDQQDDRDFLSDPGALRPPARRSFGSRGYRAGAAFLSPGGGRVPPAPRRERPRRPQEGLRRRASWRACRERAERCDRTASEGARKDAEEPREEAQGVRQERARPLPLIASAIRAVNRKPRLAAGVFHCAFACGTR